MRVVLIAGPIASGKSALGRAVASLIEAARSDSAAVIDLDLIYEMLDPSGRPKADDQTWMQARRVAGRVASVLLDEGRYVVVEGDFVTDAALAEFEAELPPGAVLRLVMLDVNFDTALERARVDDSRGLSKEGPFLLEHYRGFRREWSEREVLHLDTSQMALADAARMVVESLIRAP